MQLKILNIFRKYMWVSLAIGSHKWSWRRGNVEKKQWKGKKKKERVRMGGRRIFLREGKKVYLLYLSIISSFTNLQQVCMAYRIKPIFTVGAVTGPNPLLQYIPLLCVLTVEHSCCCLCSLRKMLCTFQDIASWLHQEVLHRYHFLTLFSIIFTFYSLTCSLTPSSDNSPLESL